MIPRFFRQVIGACLSLACLAGVGRADDYYHDFRTKPLPAEMTLFNGDDGATIRQEPQGLRITIPKTYIHPWGGVGMRTSFGFEGDFEVTLSYEILHAETPLTGFGVGVALYVAKPDGAGGSGIYRLVHPGDAQVVFRDLDRGEAAPKPRYVGGMAPCTEKIGRLRLKRTGTTLHYLWAAGTEGEEFVEFDQAEFGADPIARIRFAALTGRQPCDLDVRLFDLRIRSQKVEHAAMVAGPTLAAPIRWRLWVALGLVLLLALGGLLAVLTRRRGRGRAEPAKGAQQLAADESA